MSETVTMTASKRARLKMLGWVAIASMLALVILGPTAGGVSATSLAQATPISSADVALPLSDPECADANIGPGQVLWHFVLVQTAAPVAGSTLTATFTTAGVQVVGATKKTGSTLHFDVITGPDTLLGAFTNVSGYRLNLSHVCSGGTLTTTTTTTTTSSSTTTTQTSTTATGS